MRGAVYRHEPRALLFTIKGQKPAAQLLEPLRWHIQDPICYDSDLRVTIQALGWGPHGKYKLLSDDIASVAYWYQAEPRAPFPALPPPAERVPFQAPPKNVPGAIEGEDLKTLAISGGNAARQDVSGTGWRGGAHW